MLLEHEVYSYATQWVIEAGEMIRNLMRNELDIRIKLSHSDLVTRIDEEVERFLVEKIRAYYPDHNIIGEENIHNVKSSSTYMWIIDPIDGTTNLINRKQDFAISVAFCEQNRGIFGIVNAVMNDMLLCSFHKEGAYMNGNKLEMLPLDNRLENELLAVTLPWSEIHDQDTWRPYSKLIAAARGIRVYGASTLELSDIALSRSGAYVHHDIKAYDYAASRVILEEIGCKFTDLSGQEINWTYNGGIIAAIPTILEQIVFLLKSEAR